MMTLLFQIGQGILAVIGLVCVLSLGFVFALGLWAVPGNEEEPDWDTANYDPETGNRRREFSEPADDFRTLAALGGPSALPAAPGPWGWPGIVTIDEIDAPTAPSPQQYSDLPAQWTRDHLTTLPAYMGDVEPVNGHPILESGFDMPEAAR
jgi:hypothetical protein